MKKEEVKKDEVVPVVEKKESQESDVRSEESSYIAKCTFGGT